MRSAAAKPATPDPMIAIFKRFLFAAKQKNEGLVAACNGFYLNCDQFFAGYCGVVLRYFAMFCKIDFLKYTFDT
jgi:hypothetical protein